MCVWGGVDVGVGGCAGASKQAAKQTPFFPQATHKVCIVKRSFGCELLCMCLCIGVFVGVCIRVCYAVLVLAIARKRALV